MAKAIRDIYGEEISILGNSNENIVLLDADVSNSTKSCIFAKAHPDRFFNMGIAEANMFATAAGLATTGKIPFVNTFAVFATTIGLLPTRALYCYGNLNVKIAGSYCGMSDALDGASHHATEDISAMRALPNMTIVVPSDEISTRYLTRYAVEHYGPVYIRISRESYPAVYEEGQKFEEGKGVVVRDGKDVTIFACGIMVGQAVKAAECLEKKGISAQVVDMLFIKPIDEALVVECAKKTGAVVTAEEHNIYGGLGSAVSDVLSKNAVGVPHEFIGIQDTFAESGKYPQLLEKYNLLESDVVEACERAINRK